VINRCGSLAGKVISGRATAALMRRTSKDEAKLTDQPTHEENILYLMIELDHALARKTPQWAPEQLNAARRWVTSLFGRLLQIIPQS
jgi:hypothetical protein